MFSRVKQDEPRAFLLHLGDTQWLQFHQLHKYGSSAAAGKKYATFHSSKLSVFIAVLPHSIWMERPGLVSSHTERVATARFAFIGLPHMPLHYASPTGNGRTSYSFLGITMISTHGTIAVTYILYFYVYSADITKHRSDIILASYW
jgi:hypothetical protein